MTERDWLASKDPLAMLEYLNRVTGSVRGFEEIRKNLPSDRKLRLIAAAAMRTAVTGIRLKACNAEQGAEDAEIWAETGKRVSRASEYYPDETPRHHVVAYDHAQSAIEWSEMWDEAMPLKAEIIRDIVGNPFKPVSLCGAGGIEKTEPTPACSACGVILRAHANAVASIAQRIYDERDYTSMPILGDALEDAGCDVVEILEHCRNQQPHYRGCWVVDLILGKE